MPDGHDHSTGNSSLLASLPFRRTHSLWGFLFPLGSATFLQTLPDVWRAFVGVTVPPATPFQPGINIPSSHFRVGRVVGAVASSAWLLLPCLSLAITSLSTVRTALPYVFQSRGEGDQVGAISWRSIPPSPPLRLADCLATSRSPSVLVWSGCFPLWPYPHPVPHGWTAFGDRVFIRRVPLLLQPELLPGGKADRWALSMPRYPVLS